MEKLKYLRLPRTCQRLTCGKELRESGKKLEMLSCQEAQLRLKLNTTKEIGCLKQESMIIYLMLTVGMG